MLTTDVSVGDLLTATSVAVSVAALTYALWKDRALRRTEQADKIRSAAGFVVAKLVRFGELTSSYFGKRRNTGAVENPASEYSQANDSTGCGRVETE